MHRAMPIRMPVELADGGVKRTLGLGPQQDKE
jgi:hypothetical protein